jgi:hypothetical protein
MQWCQQPEATATAPGVVLAVQVLTLINPLYLAVAAAAAAAVAAVAAAALQVAC